jgi:SHS family lactate transporter-like MFS transporter
MGATLGSTQSRTDQFNAVFAGFLGWTLDAFDFFILVMVITAVAKDFHVTVPAIALALTGSLMTRPIGAILFGIMADRYGRKLPLMLNVVFYATMSVLSGLAPSYRVFIILRLLFGIGMGGEWGVGASLTMESVPVRLRGFLSGVLQGGYTFGFLLAALAYYLIFPHWGWRMMFFVGGVPALLSLFIRYKVKETEAWHQNRTDWKSYGKAIASNWKRFLYMLLLLMFMNSMSHGTQDMFPTYLTRQLHYAPKLVAMITMLATLGNVCGALTGGRLSDRWGRRRVIMTAVTLALFLIPLWMWAPNIPTIIIGAFLMQFMVTGAWGVMPAHMNELSPPQLRGFFPGFVYQMGVLCASSISYIEARLGEHLSYSRAMSMSMVVVLACLWLTIKFGPEAKGVAFVKPKEPSTGEPEPVLGPAPAGKNALRKRGVAPSPEG